LELAHEGFRNGGGYITTSSYSPLPPKPKFHHWHINFLLNF